MKILMAMPCYTGLVPVETCRSLVTMEKPVECAFTILDRGQIAPVRNEFVRYAIKNKLDGILMIDDDNPPPQNTLTRYLDSDKDIIGALIPKRKPNYEVCCYYKHFNKDKSFHAYRHMTGKPETELVEVDAIGSGLTYYKTKVFIDFIEHYNNVKIKDIDLEYPKLIKPFDYMYVDNVALSEDLSFCYRITELGYKIYCDTTIRPVHLAEPKQVGINDKFEVFIK